MEGSQRLAKGTGEVLRGGALCSSLSELQPEWFDFYLIYWKMVQRVLRKYPTAKNKT